MKHTRRVRCHQEGTRAHFEWLQALRLPKDFTIDLEIEALVGTFSLTLELGELQHGLERVLETSKVHTDRQTHFHHFFSFYNRIGTPQKRALKKKETNKRKGKNFP